jgi:hypothetical protein
LRVLWQLVQQEAALPFRAHEVRARAPFPDQGAVQRLDHEGDGAAHRHEQQQPGAVARGLDERGAGRLHEEPGREQRRRRGGDEAQAVVEDVAGDEDGEEEGQQRIAGRHGAFERQGQRQHRRHDAAGGEVLGPHRQGAGADDERGCDGPSGRHDHRERPGAAKSPAARWVVDRDDGVRAPPRPAGRRQSFAATFT